MKRSITILAVLIGMTVIGVKPADAQQRYIVRTTGGLTSVLHLCAAANCQVQGALDGNVGQTYLVTSAGNLVSNLLNGVVNLLEALLGIKSVEPDQLLPLPQVPVNSVASGLYDTTPVDYYGVTAWHGYVDQPATQIIRLIDAQNGFGISGTGVVAVIDTGVDPNHPVLFPVLLPGYDFTRNQPGASEWLDVSNSPNGPSDSDDDGQTVVVQQVSRAVVVHQQSAAILDGDGGSAFGHGTMTSGLVHLVAPNARILPLKAFTSDGTGYLSNIVAALYYAVQHHANVVSMSFSLANNSPALTQAVTTANQAGVVLVAAAGNNDSSAPVYPAAMNGYVVGVASTSNVDQRSSFSNYGKTDVWLAAPGENVISTYPGGTYASASGTSFSAPLVAGSASLMLSARPAINQSKAASALSHAQLLTPDVVNGRLDVYQAVGAWLSAR